MVCVAVKLVCINEGNEMTDLSSEQLNGKYKQAYDFSMSDLLQTKQDLDAAKQEIEELKFKLTDAQVKIDSMDKLNDMFRDQLQIAITDRKVAMDQRAEYAVRLDMLRNILNDTGTGGKPE